MTGRTSWTIRCFVWSLPVLLAIVVIWKPFHPTVIWYKNRMAQVKQIGLALKLYADDHEGTLPQRLEDMMPTYFTKRELLENVQLVTPSAKLPELASRTVIARRTFPEDHWIGEVYADMSTEARQF